MKKALSTSTILFLGLVCLFTLSACSSKQIRPTLDIPKKDASLEELLSRYQQHAKMHSNIKALVKIETDLGERGHHSIRATWHSTRDLIQLRGFSLLGGDLFRLDIDDTSFSLKTPADPQTFEADLDLFEEVAGKQIPFGSIDLLRWVQRGGLPDTAFPKIPVLEKRENHFIIYLFSVFEGRAILVDKLFIERTTFRIKRVELFDHTGVRRGLIKLDDYRLVEGREFPFLVTGIAGNGVITLKFEEVSFPLTVTENIE